MRRTCACSQSRPRRSRSAASCCTSGCRRSRVSSLCSSDLSDSAARTGNGAPATARAASARNSARNTDSLASTSRSNRPSSCQDCSNTTSMLACRVGCAESVASQQLECPAAVRRRSRRTTERVSRPRRVRARAAALRPGGRCRRLPMPRSPAPARVARGAQRARTGAPRRMPRCGRDPRPRGTADPSSGSSHSVRQRQSHARRDHEFHERARREQLLKNPPSSIKLFEIVEHEQHLAFAQASMTCSSSSPRAL